LQCYLLIVLLFQGDAGLTGRKIIVDTYGGWGAHGGGAFSGKDYTKVDRSAAYAARWVAKSLVKGGICRRCLVQVEFILSYLALETNEFFFVLGVLRYWFSGTALNHDFRLRHIQVQPGSVTRNCQEELRLEAWCDRQKPKPQESHLPKN